MLLVSSCVTRGKLLEFSASTVWEVGIIGFTAAGRWEEDPRGLPESAHTWREYRVSPCCERSTETECGLQSQRVWVQVLAVNHACCVDPGKRRTSCASLLHLENGGTRSYLPMFSIPALMTCPKLGGPSNRIVASSGGGKLGEWVDVVLHSRSLVVVVGVGAEMKGSAAGCLPTGD